MARTGTRRSPGYACATRAAVALTGGDLGCLLHLKGRMARQGKALEVRHATAEILADMGGEPALGGEP